MGSKKLKAVVPCGNKQIKVQDSKTIKEINKEYSAKIRAANFSPGMPNSALYYGAKQTAEKMKYGDLTHHILK